MMNEWVRMFDNSNEMEGYVNSEFKKGYKLVNFDMELSHGSMCGCSYKDPVLVERYFVHMCKGE